MHEELPAAQTLFLKRDVRAVALAGLRTALVSISVLCHGHGQLLGLFTGCEFTLACGSHPLQPRAASASSTM